MKLKNKIIHWLGGITQYEADMQLLKIPTQTITITHENFVPLTYAAKTMVNQSTIDAFGLDNVISATKKDLARQIADRMLETTNLISYSQDKNFDQYGSNTVITAKATIFVKEN